MDLNDLNLSDSLEEDIRCMIITDNPFMCDSTDQEDSLLDFLSETNTNFSIEINHTHEMCTDSGQHQEKDNKQFLKNTGTIKLNQSEQHISNSYLKESAILERNPKSTACVKDSNSRSSTRASQRKVVLSRRAYDFKKLFYQFFTSKKRFSKYLVKQIHEIMLIPCQLKKMTREEFRRIDLYFQNYAKFSDQILIYLHNHKEELLEEIPELSNLD